MINLISSQRMYVSRRGEYVTAAEIVLMAQMKSIVNLKIAVLKD